MAKMKGFTIVELLIVIVVIAILAAISVVAYNGIQERANNTATINAANQSIKAISAYIAANGSYPGTQTSCITTVSGCTSGGATVASQANFENVMSSIATLPRSINNVAGSLSNGIYYVYGAARTYSGASQPATVWYFLTGQNKQCGVSNVTNSGSDTMNPSTNGWTATNSTVTTCVITIPGPAHS